MSHSTAGLVFRLDVCHQVLDFYSKSKQQPPKEGSPPPPPPPPPRPSKSSSSTTPRKRSRSVSVDDKKTYPSGWNAIRSTYVRYHWCLAAKSWQVEAAESTAFSLSSFLGSRSRKVGQAADCCDGESTLALLAPVLGCFQPIHASAAVRQLLQCWRRLEQHSELDGNEGSTCRVRTCAAPASRATASLEGAIARRSRLQLSSRNRSNSDVALHEPAAAAARVLAAFLPAGILAHAEQRAVHSGQCFVCGRLQTTDPLALLRLQRRPLSKLPSRLPSATQLPASADRALQCSPSPGAALHTELQPRTFSRSHDATASVPWVLGTEQVVWRWAAAGSPLATLRFSQLLRIVELYNLENCCIIHLLVLGV